MGVEPEKFQDLKAVEGQVVERRDDSLVTATRVLIRETRRLWLCTAALAAVTSFGVLLAIIPR
ncbi:hypothetical protein [Streptacidiphilus sp. P02-A3a]|uniref:hypothetical protein n=1 Tax=Streptacidiphilus sp. P02-A3a TaxID=2704468 RepID=UPI0015FBCF58|nr:hypothetical protein [Streptacidiphilus sp. P02-A3a]QMU69157.1 hypothetical protein GXP74_13765 [Streptacidiphilus sp. P02-A3a]